MLSDILISTLSAFSDIQTSSVFSPGNQAVAKVQRSTSFGVPNANSIKQMLLDWCRAKTRCYEVTPTPHMNRPCWDGTDSSTLLYTCTFEDE